MNKKTLFYAHPRDIRYIEDTVLQHEEMYVPGFYRLVSGNTEDVRSLYDGQVFDLGEEKVTVSFTGSGKNETCLCLNNGGIKVFPGEVSLPPFYYRRVKVKETA
jgi:hypothetical protein